MKTAARTLAAGMAVLCLASQALAGGGIGPQGMLGPRGATGPAGAGATSPPPGAGAQYPYAGGHTGAGAQQPPSGNHIEASDNAAGGVRCSGAGASVNSVDVQGARLEGRTVIVQGRNTRDVDTRDCTPPAAGPAPAAQTNSIRIR